VRTRRDFITLLGGAASASTWPLAAGAQGDRVRLVGVLMSVNADDPYAQANVAALRQGLQDAGWVVGQNVRFDVRWSSGDVAAMRRDALELIGLGPDVIVGGVGPTAAILQQATRTVPVVFAQAVDPVGGGFVHSLSRPGGNMTGFIQFEYSLAGKWLELLKEIMPRVVRVGVVRQMVGGPVGIAMWAVIQAFASPVGVELSPINTRGIAGEIETAVSAFAPGPNDGMIVTAGTSAVIERQLIVALADRHRLPTVYFNRLFVESGGLISYGPNLVDGYRRAAGYVDRILKGEKPADLPVQAPTKYELVINLKTAKALGLTVPPALLARADEVIE
jgi:putative ABC transport system substrate-binding protein